MNPNLRTTTLPRANPADVQAVVELWKAKHPGQPKEEFRAWTYLVVNHFFPSPDPSLAEALIDKTAAAGTMQHSVPRGPFCAGAWCQEDVDKCRAALEAMK